jgi:mannose-6-phosphate isomerase-like protein (cupin superfamily)
MRCGEEMCAAMSQSQRLRCETTEQKFSRQDIDQIVRVLFSRPFISDPLGKVNMNKCYEVLHTTPQLQLVVYRVKPRSKTEFPVMYGVTRALHILSGKGSARINSNPIELISEGSIMMIPPNTVVEIENTNSSGDLRISCVYSCVFYPASFSMPDLQ